MPSPPLAALRSRGAGLCTLRLVNASELVEGLTALPGSQDAGSDGNGIAASRLVNGIEYAQTGAVDEPKLRAAFKRRQGGGATPLVLVGDDPEQPGYVRVLGPQRDGPLRRVRADSFLGVVGRTISVKRLQAVRLLAEELDRLDTERIAGLKVVGLGTEHLYGKRLPGSQRWAELEGLVVGASRQGWRELLTSFGYTMEPLKPEGYLARYEGEPVLVVFPRATAWLFARLDEHGRLPEGALVAECRAHGAPYGVLAAGTRLRLLAAGHGQAGTATRYLELDAAALEPQMQPLLGLLAPPYLAEGGLAEVLSDARDHGQEIRRRLDRVLREDVLPVLGRELGRWAQRDGRDLAADDVRADLEAAALLFIFRALFVLYAESAGHLPMANPTYRSKSLTRLAERAWEERDAADPQATALWDDIAAVVRRMRTGQTAWELPAYNGDLFAADTVAGAATLEVAAIADAELGPALVALARDPVDPEVGVDFSGLEIGHLGYIYEGLLSLRLSLADRDFAYDAKRDRYVTPPEGGEPDARAGELLWLTNEGGRKGGGVYYTRTELVRHLVRGAVGPAFERHLAEVRDVARTDPAAAAERLFDFAVLDPACGSAHFLVEVVDELADKIAELLGEVALPAVRAQLDALRAKAASFGAGIEDTALLKRLVLKHCVYGVDLSSMGVEIAKVSLWLGTFVPGLSLAYLDHNVQRGNSLIGVARVEDVTERGALLGEPLREAIAAAAAAAAQLRAIDDTTPEQVAASRQADRDLREQEAGARAIFDLWTAEPLGIQGARDEALINGDALLAGGSTPKLADASALAARERFLHWPLAFAEVFARESPGFDAVVGNPPWEEVTIEEQSFYARYRPGIRRGVSQIARTQAVRELLAERPDLSAQLAAERDRVALLRKSFASEYASSLGDPDLYKLFCQRYRDVLRIGGMLGVVLPRNAFASKGSSGFRKWLLENAPPLRIDFLRNRRRWAFDVHPQQSVALAIARRTNEAAGPAAAFEVAGVAESAKEFQEQIDQPGLEYRVPALGRHLEFPLLRSQTEADLLTRLRSTGPLPFGGGRWRCFPVREFDETNDRMLWADADDGWPLWKGESIGQFDPHGAGQRLCPASQEALSKARKSRPGAESLVAERVPLRTRRAAVERSLSHARLAFMDVTQRTNSRTVIACLVPPGHFLTNTAPYLAFVDDDPSAEAACLALMNSLAFDWQARRFVEIHLNFFVLEGLRIPDLDDATFSAIAEAAARLSCVDERFAGFAGAVGVSAEALSEDERAALRADIDARVAHAWGLTADELEVVFADFTLDAVPEPYRAAVRERFAALG